VNSQPDGGHPASHAARDASEAVYRTVQDLVAGSGIDFQGLGLHELKGIPGEWQLFSAG
jgi:hypothetical protein